MDPRNFIPETRRVWEWFIHRDKEYILMNLGGVAICSIMTGTGSYMLAEGSPDTFSAVAITSFGAGLGVERIVHIVHDSRNNKNYSE